MKKWEYKSVALNADPNVCIELGKQGWELATSFQSNVRLENVVNAVSRSGHDITVTFDTTLIFKRPLVG